MTLKLRIEKLIYGGEGLARIPGEGRRQTVFLPHVLPGEEVEAGGWLYRVVDMDGLRIDKVEVSRQEPVRE